MSDLPLADRARRVPVRLDVVAVVFAAAPIALHALRAAIGNWRPVGDDAYFTLRSLDVGTEHHPLVGAWSSASVDVDRLINNLGPLQFDLLAPFTRWAPAGGTAIGVAVVHLAAIATVAWLLGRLGGRAAVSVGMVPIALLAWNMGSDNLLAAQQHQFLLFACLAFLVSAWAVAAGETWAPVPLIAWASLLVQTHLTYPVLVAVVGVVAIVGWAAAWFADPDRVTAGSRRRVLLVTGGLALVLWSQTLIDQFFGWGNLGDVLTTPGQVDRLGWRGAGIVVDVLATPTGWVRPGYGNFDPAAAVERASLAAIVLVLVLVGLVVATAAAVRAHRRRSAAGLAVAVAALVGAWLDAALLPVTTFGLGQYNYRWLWPIGSFFLIGVLVAAVTMAPTGRRWAAGDRSPVAVAAVFVIAVLGVVNLPQSFQVIAPDRTRDEQLTTILATEQLERFEFAGPVVIDQSNLYFGHPFNYPVAIAIRQTGAEYRFEGEIQARRFGADRVADGTEPTRLVLWAGDDARRLANDPSTIVFADTSTGLAITLEAP